MPVRTPPRRRTSSGRRRWPDQLGRLGRGDLVGGDGDLELDLLADEPAALLEGDVPVEAPVGAVRAWSMADRPAWRWPLHARDDAVELDLEGRGPGDVRMVRSPVTSNASSPVWRDRGRHEGDGRVGLGVEEVGRAQVRVAGAEVRVDAGGGDGELAARAGRVGLVELDRALRRRGTCRGRSSPSCAWPRS